MKQNHILILSGGSISPGFIKQYVNTGRYLVIAADKGLNAALAAGIVPDYLVGDFDSISADGMSQYKSVCQKEGKLPIIKQFPPEKDFTDTHLALDTALALNPDEIIILGATGTRIDHLTANIHLLLLTLERKVEACIIDEHNKIFLIDSKIQVQKSQWENSYFSLIPLTEQVTGVTLKGFKYPLNQYTMKLGESIGISNEIIGETASVELESGILIAVESRD